MRKALPARRSLVRIAMVTAIALTIAGCFSERATATPIPEPGLTATPSATATPPSTTTALPTATPEPDLPQAPDFSLSTGTGETYSLDDLLTGRDALVLVFYRGYF